MMRDFNSPEAFKQGLTDWQGTQGVASDPDQLLERLQIYHDLLVHWQKSKNLIAPGTINDIWHRHFADSAQLLTYASPTQHWLDLGAGAGFPGLVIAAFQQQAVEHNPSCSSQMSMTLVEANHRKCAFLREAAREMGLTVDIRNCRIESLAHKDTIQPIDLITARALANLTDLLSLGSTFLENGAKALFLKGQMADKEIAAARRTWAFDVDLSRSMTDETGRITHINNVSMLKN